jgi:hypothetical protein
MFIADLQYNYIVSMHGALILPFALAVLLAVWWLAGKLAFLLPDPMHLDRELDFFPPPPKLDARPRAELALERSDADAAGRELRHPELSMQPVVRLTPS